jgi:hypothetical protein
MSLDSGDPVGSQCYPRGAYFSKTVTVVWTSLLAGEAKTFNFCLGRVGHRNCQQIKIAETYGQTIDEHFLMVPLVFLFNHFRGTIYFPNFSQMTPVLKGLAIIIQRAPRHVMGG